MAKKTKDLKYYEAVGRRKESVARVRLYILGKDKTVTVNGIKGKGGEFIVNKKPIKTLFGSLYEQNLYRMPLKLTNTEDRFFISVLLKGGGKTGQIEALIHGLARALDKVDKTSYHTILKKHGLFTRDPRTRERRKVGTGGKARRAKQSPKR
jgi:small subunit ribosomal protein S9